MTDQYERSAEFIDVMMAPHWPSLGPPLAEALRGVVGPVVDVGAGGGHGTRVIAQAVPEADILAVEPSPALRSVLLARVNEDPALRARVTVLPEGLLEAVLPHRLGAVVAMNVIGHFSPADRHRIWALLAERAGRAVLNLQPPTEPVAVPEFRAAEVRVGRRTYEGWGRAEPAGPDRLTWHMTYRTYQDGELVGELETSYAWWVLTEEQLKAELGEHGLEPARTGPVELGMHIIGGGDT
ncbi:methyltransferase domain-containing protein [Nonomuraea recticatena]|uniref:Methyltransferase domain-containing protein n=1 Tax=Nonomuraea recticatena TaxID=46178 RepID=A0ABP6FIQ3_9ACTN